MTTPLPRYFVSVETPPPAGFVQSEINRRTLTGGLLALHAPSMEALMEDIEPNIDQIHGVLLLPGDSLLLEQKTKLLWLVHYPPGLKSSLKPLAEGLLELVGQLFQQLNKNIESDYYGHRLSREVEAIRTDYNHVTNKLLQQVSDLETAQSALQEVNEALEARVDERTRELTQANEELQRAIQHLTQVEKLAALARLVAGISHELNTPLGNIVTVSTTLENSVNRLNNAILNNMPVKRSQLMENLEMMTNGLNMISHNAARGTDLIEHFKQISTDQTSMRQRKFELEALINEVLFTLAHLLKPTPFTVQTCLECPLTLNSYPGALEQIITLLINNSLVHGFAQRNQGTILMKARQLTDGWIEFIYSDDGAGMNADTMKHAFEPFYTSRLGQGGSGLGLSIVHNLISGPLSGSVELISEPDKGVTFTFTFPCSPE